MYVTYHKHTHTHTAVLRSTETKCKREIDRYYIILFLNMFVIINYNEVKLKCRRRPEFFIFFQFCRRY